MNDQKHNQETDDLLAMLGNALPPELRPQTNRTAAAAVRDNERKLIAAGVKPVDLSQIPNAERGRYHYLSVTVPNSIASYLENCEFPLSQNEVNMLEIEMEKHHKAEDPCYIQMTATFRETGKRYEFLPECEEFDSGFIYLHNT